MQIYKDEYIWYEKYKTQKITDVILPLNMKKRIQDAVTKEDIPNYGFFGNVGGIGKSTACHAIITEIGCEALWINASLENGIDVIRSKITKFASSCSFDDKIKIVVLDECLEENEEVQLGSIGDTRNVKLNSLEKGKIYDCVSFNQENGQFENDTCEVISDKESDVYEVELEDGRTIKVTDNHPFIIKQNGKYVEKTIKDGLNENDKVVIYGSSSSNVKKITKITPVAPASSVRVINLTVHKNHTFVTANGIVTHNCDNLSYGAQAAFRGFIDEFSNSCRFIFTGNYKEKIIPALLTRLEDYDFGSFDKKEMVKPIFERLSFILNNEGIKFEKEALIPVINTFYPSIRSMIGALQKYSNLETKTFAVEEHELDGADSLKIVMQTVLQKDFNSMYTQVNNINNPDNMYTFLYNNLFDYFPKNAATAVIAISKYQHMSDTVRDKQLNLAGLLAELMRI